MSNNLFLAGDLHVGKSTLIDKVIDNLTFFHISGFRTSRYFKNKRLEGFYIEDIRQGSKEQKNIFIGRCINENHWVSIPSTFDDYGVKILEDCLKGNPDLIVMDELGFFESNAIRFQDMVLNILDSDTPVLGVLKLKETPFLNTIRNKKDVRVFAITQENRDAMFSVIIDKIENVICRNREKKQVSIDALDFEKTVNEVFAPVYPIIAKQIKNRTQITDGICLDVGSGTGHLGIEMAKVTNLEVYLLDKSKDMLSLAEQNIARSCMENRLNTVLGDVYCIPMGDNTVDLVISRGSLFFWEDREKAFKEINRVLAPGGMAYVGGGFGTYRLKKKIDIEMQKRDSHWRKNMVKKVDSTNIDYHELLKALDISDIQVINNEANMWVILRKGMKENSAAAHQKTLNL